MLLGCLAAPCRAVGTYFCSFSAALVSNIVTSDVDRGNHLNN